MTATAARRRRGLAARPRRLITVLHVVTAVGLAGVAAAVLTLAALGDPAGYPTLSVLANGLGMPAALLGLMMGLLSGWLSPWGILRHGWVVVKFGLLLVVLACGAFVIGPAAERIAADPGDGTARTLVLVGEAAQLALLLVATLLSVVKPRAIIPGTR